MLKEKFTELKESFKTKSEGKNSKKTIENLIVLGIILIVTVIFINYIWNGDKKSNSNKENTNSKVLAQSQQNSDYSDSTTELENKLKNILAKINGVGTVEVMITYSQSNTTIPVYNEDIQATTTEEKDTTGGIRKITENSSTKEVVYGENNGEKSVMTQSVVSPQIEGAIVIAQGSSNANIKDNIIQAVGAVTGLATHKIQVFEMN